MNFTLSKPVIMAIQQNNFTNRSTRLFTKLKKVFRKTK